ncbi:MAG: phenylalanine--tRNA ligase subunit beta [Planctomycetaceae bacterium]|jgi:phenylalanyl-tRNA synthetase beta chain|nr:phenylalanine--tRNA ligase subunit beta [Planctomycetaceae bacterium]
MNISLDWISDYVDLSGIDVDKLSDRLTLSTAEVEGVRRVRRSIEGVIVGEVTAVERIDATHNFCNVNCGSKDYVTVCGAANVKVGLKAPFAPAGTVLANNQRIETTKKFGKTSEGILCSAAEIGLSSWHEIVFEVPRNISNGVAFLDLMSLTDVLIEIDNKSLTHRPDLWGHYGFAREFSVIFNRELKPLPQLDLDQFAKLPEYSLQNCDYDNCPVFGCIEFLTCGVIPSPIYMQRRLHALGLRTYNLLVDVTNYVNLEIGQPTHAYDADKLGGVKIATAGDHLKFTTLDNQTRNLLPEDLLIWGSRQSSGDYRPVGLAGIMGGAETEVTETTTKILLEAANFKAVRIRRTSGRLDLRTDAAQRYEKTQPPANIKVAAARILKLVSEAAAESESGLETGSNLKVLSKFTVDGDLRDKVREIIIPAGRFEQLSGIKIPQEQILNILQSLGFEAKFNLDGSLIAGAPPFRSEKDISIPEDIIEEVLRIYGYDNIPPVTPLLQLRPLFVEKRMKLEHKIQKLLTAGHGFLEVHNYVWFNDAWLKLIGFDAGKTLELRNPVSPETTKLRTTLIPNLLALIPKNRPFRDKFNLFEIGRVFYPENNNEKNNENNKNDKNNKDNNNNNDKSNDKGKGCIEESRLAGVSFRQSAAAGNSLEEFYLLIKSAVEDIFSVCGVSGVRFVESSSGVDVGASVGVGGGGGGGGDAGVSVGECGGFNVLPAWCSAGSWVKVMVGDVDAGSMGVLDKAMMSKISPEGGGVVWFELLLDKIGGVLFPNVKFVEPPRYPLSWQDFSLVWGIEDGFGSLENLLDLFNDPLIVKREFLVSYKGKGLEKDKASYSFRFWIGATDRTLSGEEIDKFHQRFLDFIKEKNISLRK